MKFYSILFLILISFWGNAQEPVSIHITEKDGLLDNEIYSIAEDNNGVIWLAGNKGLTRYDGTDFKTLSHPKKRGLSVFEVSIDDKNRVWVVNISGQVFYVENDVMYLFADLQKEMTGELPDIVISKNTLVVSKSTATIYFDLDSAKRKEVNDEQRKINLRIRPLKVNDSLLLFGYNNLLKIDGVNEEIVNELDLIQNLPKQIKRLDAGKLTSLSDGQYLLQFNDDNPINYFFLINNKNDVVSLATPDELKSAFISAITEIDGILWFSTRKGAIRCKIIDGKILYIDTLLKDQFVTNVLKDNDNNYWLTTLEDHVYVLPNLGISQISLDNDFGKFSRMIVGKNSDLLIGYASGKVVGYDTESAKQITYTTPSNRRVSAIGYNKYANSYIVNQETKSYEFFLDEKTSAWNALSNLANVKDIRFISKNKAVMSSSQSSSIGNYRDIEFDFNWTSRVRGYTCHYSESDNKAYTAQIDKVVVIDSLYKQKEIKDNNGKPILVQDFTQDFENNVWASSLQNGIYKIKNDKIAEAYNAANGLLSNRINAIAADSLYLWIATDNGIQRFNTKTNNFRNLLIQDGVPNYSIKDIVVGKTSVYFCSADQIFSINKQNAFKEFKNSPVYINSFLINGEEASRQTTHEVSSEQSELNVSFRANGFRAMSSGDYSYTLTGKKWVKIPRGTNSLQFSQLPLGKNKFIVKSVDTKGNETLSKPIVLLVKQPFYKRTWVIIVLASLLLAIIAYYFKRKLRLREKEKNKEFKRLALDNELINLRLENLRSQMNPHFIFNALNSIQEHIVGNKTEAASDYLVKFAKLIRMYLDHSRLGIVSLKEEYKALELYLELEKLRFGNKLNYNNNLNVADSLEHIAVPPLFIQPYVENALKHGLLNRKTDRQLHISFIQNEVNAPLKVIILDNGIGRKAAQLKQQNRPQNHNSFATSANEQRVDLLNKDRVVKIEVKINDLYEGEIAKGTEVVILIPQKK